MAKIFLGLGSNIHPKAHLREALQMLEQRFGHLAVSPTYESEAIGFKGDNFLNLVISTHTALPVGQLQNQLKDIEDQTGRDRNAPKFSGRTLDIDILLYDDQHGLIDGIQLPREEILVNAFVLKPLFDLSPDTVHPSEQKTIRTLWQTYDQSKQKLWLTTLSD